MRPVRVLVAAVVVLTFATATWAAPGASPTVPTVAGKEMAAAAKTLVAAGYYADTAPVTSERVGRGKVVRQQPRAGATLQHGKPVRLAISIGGTRTLLPGVKIPNLLGKSAREARAMLVQKKLTMATKFRTTVSSKDGKVIAQNPLGGVFRQYQTVTILVGK
jgi:eukaryotic-like serine/threonine-protein kinase